MSNKGYYNTDKKLESEGVWQPLPNGAEILCARSNNPEYKKLQKELVRPYSKIVRVGGEIPDDKQDEMLVELLAKTCVKDWRNFPHVETGEIIPFSVQAAREQMTLSVDLRNDIATCANDIYQYHSKANQDATGN